jgi:polyhydroxyalkanoate synthesis regulator phasin
MAAELGGSQISALLESVPGIASVLRSPVADALVGMMRAGAGLGEFRMEDVNELTQYAVRRGLISSDESEHLLKEIKGRGRAPKVAGKAKKAAKSKTAKKARRKAAATATSAKKRSSPRAKKR